MDLTKSEKLTIYWALVDKMFIMLDEIKKNGYKMSKSQETFWNDSKNIIENKLKMELNK